MDIKYRKSLLAGVIATLMASPGWLAAQQTPTPPPYSGHEAEPLGAPPAPAAQSLPAAPGSANRAMNPAGKSAQGADPLLSALAPEHLKQMDVVDASGEKIGKIKEVVRSRDDGLIYAVVASGGILGIGGTETPVLLEELRVHGDKLSVGTTKKTLKNWPAYKKDQYVELKPSNQPISDFAAFEVTPPEGAKKIPAPEQAQ